MRYQQTFVGVQIQAYQRTLRPVSQHYRLYSLWFPLDKLLLYKFECGLARVYMIATSISPGILRNLITSPQALSDHWRYAVSLALIKHYIFWRLIILRPGFKMYKYIASCLSHATSQTVVHIYIHTARKTDGELDSLTVLLSWKQNKNHPRWDSNPGKPEYKFRETSFYRLRHKPLTNLDKLWFFQTVPDHKHL